MRKYLEDNIKTKNFKELKMNGLILSHLISIILSHLNENKGNLNSEIIYNCLVKSILENA